MYVCLKIYANDLMIFFELSMACCNCIKVLLQYIDVLEDC